MLSKLNNNKTITELDFEELMTTCAIKQEDRTSKGKSHHHLSGAADGVLWILRYKGELINTRCLDTGAIEKPTFTQY